MVTAGGEDGLFLALDTGSPVVSVAIARAAAVTAERSIEIGRSSERLVALIDAVLEESGNSLESVDGIVALRGPGSFTGLRVGLATVLGLHQALGVEVAALPTHAVLAEVAESRGRIVTAVDALRDEWFVALFEPSTSLGAAIEVQRCSSLELCRIEAEVAVGFGLQRLASAAVFARTIEPPPLAAVAARMASSWPRWDAADLTAPLYLREAAVTRPRS